MNHKKNLLLLIVGNLDYPRGSAPSNRIHAYAKALQNANVSTLVLSLGTPFNKHNQIKYKGIFEGISYIYTTGQTIRENNFILRNILKIKSFFNLLHIIKRLKKKRDVVLLEFTRFPLNEILLSIFAKLNKIPVVKEANELPYIFIDNKKHNFLSKWINLKIRPKFYDGMIIISEYLKSFYQTKIKKTTLVIHIPILVDLKRFKKEKKKHNEKYFLYCGSMDGNKDGVEILIKAFNKVNAVYPNVKLYLIGTASSTKMKYLKNLVSNLNLSNKIKFLGHIDREKIPEFMINAFSLVLSRPESLQAKAGFPTKLGEYLSTANPVIVTRVGEIDKFLEHKKSALIARPGSIDDFAKKMIFLLENESLAKDIGENGKKVAETFFDYLKYGKPLKNFMEKLYTNDKF